jgi:mannosyltransferase
MMDWRGIGRSQWLFVALMLGILWVAYATRFHLIESQSLWNDEGTSYAQALRTLPQIAEHAGRDIHPPAYYWLLAVWGRLAGHSELGLRALSALASVLTVAVTFALGKRLFNPAVGILSAGLVTLNTFSIYYAQEARMYALLALIAVGAFYLFVLFMARPTRSRMIGLAVVNALGLYTHYAFPFVMLAQGVAFVVGVFNRRVPLKQIIPYTALNVGTIVLFLPLLPTAWRQITTWPSTGEAIPTQEAIATILGYFAFGITTGAGVTIAVAFFLLFALIQLENDRKPHQAWRVSVPFIWVVGSVLVFLVMGLFRESNLKFLLPAQIGFALWMARGAWALWQTQVHSDKRYAPYIPKIASVVGAIYIGWTLVDGLPALYHDRAYQRDDYRAMAQIITADTDEQDAVIINGAGQIEVFDYYYQGQAQVFPLPQGLGGDDAETLRQTQAVIERSNTIYAILWGTGERDPNHVVENTLNQQAYQVDDRWFGDVRLVRYVSPIDWGDKMIADRQQFGTHITLTEYGISHDTIRAGDVMQLQLVWTIDAPTDQRYKVFIQLLDENGVLVAQRDSEPVGNSQPTHTWEAGQMIVDQHALLIPDHLPSAHYSLIIGLYNLVEPYERLFLPNGDDSFLIAPTVLITD